MSVISRLVRNEIYSLPSYTAENTKKDVIALHRNENPWNDFQFANFANLNRYPDSQPLLLRKLLANIYTVKQENILLTRGSDEAIDLVIKLFCAPCKNSILICPPTFGMYEISAKLQSVDVIKVALQPDSFALNLTAIETAMNPDVKIIFVCSPNNPTGNLIDVESIASLCDKYRDQAIVLVDEAYFDYAEGKSCITLLNKKENLVILKTLSKAYGLAAIRCGMAFANTEIINLMQKIISPYPISLLSSLAAQSALSAENLQVMRQRIVLLKFEREKLIARIKQFSWVEKVWPSCANFFLVKVKTRKNLKEYCAEKNILIRDVSNQLNLTDCIRISVGKPEENNYLVQILDEFS